MGESALLADRYPAAPDGAAEVERSAISFDDVKYNRHRFTQEAFDAYAKAAALDRWWRTKRKAERAAASGVLPVTDGQNSANCRPLRSIQHGNNSVASALRRQARRSRGGGPLGRFRLRLGDYNFRPFHPCDRLFAKCFALASIAPS